MTNAIALSPVVDAEWVFRRYESVRDRLPTLPEGTPATTRSRDLSTLFDAYDVFVLDGFGVLNVGEAAIPDAVKRIGEMRAAGRRVIVLTNAATNPPAGTLDKYHRLGFDFTADEIVSSRDVTMAAMARFPAATRWGVTAHGPASMVGLPANAFALGEDDAKYDEADAFILLSGGAWDGALHAHLVAALKRQPRPVLVANPDLVAPREDGLSIEPGYWAHDLMDATGVAAEFFGKPFGNAFDAVIERLGPDAPPPHRMAMVGDTLHTDILGGRAAGFGTILITDHGIFAGQEVDPYIDASGIVPHHIVETT
ncbi:HAD family hydrolase [Acuticoccus sp. M5D2P5]|uniref:HAD-IIA family hydrolase n=1 Tax=Acuticoccus kalidii TaxID=2910977 RepID=UPI001F44A57E|nr:HAD family hydrolase [Acuticoccus kalidii]MCF3932424.1 HAD family hydrolase [Acuticoccus kalidii]